jgi:ethylbenzene hydroxylase subunit beta/complex iron-sulfur molybdoenzyme family reductase subunit beta
VDQHRVAIPLHPDFGTEPNIFYVPPLAPPRFDEKGEIDESKPRIPNEYLVGLFGPDVLRVLDLLKSEIEKVRAGGKSEMLHLLIGYRWHEMFGGFDRDPATIEWSRQPKL